MEQKIIELEQKLTDLDKAIAEVDSQRQSHEQLCALRQQNIEQRLDLIVSAIDKMSSRVDEDTSGNARNTKDIYAHIDLKVEEIHKKVNKIIWGALIIALSVAGMLWKFTLERTADRYTKTDHQHQEGLNNALRQKHIDALDKLIERMGK